jgi:hypothetical protein
MAIQLTSPTEVTSYLNTTQTTLNELGTYDPLESGSVDKFMEENLGMTGTMPEAPKYVDMYKGMREEFGVSEMEQSMAWYKDAIRREELLLNQQKNYQREQPVRLGVIEGRVDKATRDRQEQMQWYGNELSRVSDMVQGAYNQINMIMQFTQMDYETAKEQYQTEFNTRMSVYKAVSDQFNADRAFASTQWSMMASYISKGQTSWDQMSPDQKAQVAKYEAIMGMPIGFMSKLQMEAGANIISTTQRVAQNGGTYTDIVYKDTDGSIKSKSVYTGQTRIASSGGGSSSTASFDGNSGAIAEMEALLWKKTGTDKNVSPDTYNQYKTQWVRSGGTSYGFDANFGRFINENYAFRDANVYNLDPLYLQKLGKTGSSSTSTNPFN